MNITINGKDQSLTEQTTLKDLIAQVCKKPEHILVELNNRIIDRDRMSVTILKDGDKLELVGFVGGG